MKWMLRGTKCSFLLLGQQWFVEIQERPNEPDFGGECSLENHTIAINSRYTGDTFLNYLIHELFEAVSFTIGCNFSRSFPDPKDMYIMDHTQMDLAIQAVRSAYEMVKGQLLTKHDQREAQTLPAIKKGKPRIVRNS